VYVSETGTDWGTLKPVATGSGSSAVTTITLSAAVTGRCAAHAARTSESFLPVSKKHQGFPPPFSPLFVGRQPLPSMPHKGGPYEKPVPQPVVEEVAEAVS